MEASTFIDSLVLAVTYLGSGPGVISMALLYTWWVDPDGGRKLGIVLGVSWLLNLTLKDLFALPRPFELEGDAATAAARSTARGPGFPSGHTQATTTFWFFLAGHHRFAGLYGLAFGLALLVGASRVWLGVHFPVDVLGGFGVGLVLAWIGVRIPRFRAVPLWAGPLVVVAGLPLVVPGESFAEAAGLTVGMLLAPGDHRVPESRGQRVWVAVGGLAVLWGLYVLVEPAMERLPAVAVGTERIPAEAWVGYLRAAGLTWFAFGLWPRWVLGRRLGRRQEVA